MTRNRLIRPLFSLLFASFLTIGFAVPALADSSDRGHGGVRAVPFSATGVGFGVETSRSAPGCQFGGSCTVQITGAAAVVAGAYAFPARYQTLLTIDYSKPTFPTPGTFCAPASGSEVLTSIAHPSDTISKSLRGSLCGENAALAPHTFTGTFTITGGTGRFAGATGSGTVVAIDDGKGKVLHTQEIGTITYKGAHLKGDDDDESDGHRDGADRD